MKKLIGLLMAIVMVLGLAACGSSSSATTEAATAAPEETTSQAAEETTAEETTEEESEEETEAEVNATSIIVGSYSMMEVKTITDDSYAELYGTDTAEGAAKQAVLDIIKAGKATINGFTIPATAEEYEAEYPDGFTVNGDVWMSAGETAAYKVDRDEYEDFDEAVLALITRIPAGNEIILIDEDGDGFYDTIDAIYRAAFIINEIDGKTFERADIDDDFHKPYDGEMAADDIGLTASEVIGDPQEGDIAFAYETPDGWVVEKAYPVTGKLVEGIDHEYYQIDDTKYDDAMRFSRDNIVISNRCGEFTNALKYFGMTGEDAEFEVTLWFVQPKYGDTLGAPAGFTSEDSAEILESAINQASDKWKADHMNVPEEASDELLDAIQDAQEELFDSDSAPEELTYQLYLLYLTLHGSQDDIGASFAGYEYVGFDNQIQ